MNDDDFALAYLESILSQKRAKLSTCSSELLLAQAAVKAKQQSLDIVASEVRSLEQAVSTLRFPKKAAAV